uniref:Uncharacterized protein n=1 Tax=Cacopsylla melanoneura TaxID=428564 RepID=A0A8D8M110_9HEMI
MSQEAVTKVIVAVITKVIVVLDQMKMSVTEVTNQTVSINSHHMPRNFHKIKRTSAKSATQHMLEVSAPHSIKNASSAMGLITFHQFAGRKISQGTYALWMNVTLSLVMMGYVDK